LNTQRLPCYVRWGGRAQGFVEFFTANIRNACAPSGQGRGLQRDFRNVTSVAAHAGMWDPRPNVVSTTASAPRGSFSLAEFPGDMVPAEVQPLRAATKGGSLVISEPARD
jgi:hypothetical protein